MGNVKSCCGSICPGSKDDEDEYGERARILSDPTDASAGDDPYVTGRCSTDVMSNTMDDSLLHTQNYSWNNTLMHLAQNLIDVGSLYVPSMEQSDLTERQKLYTTRLGQLKPVFALRSRQIRNKRHHSKANKGDQIDVRRLQHVCSIQEEDQKLINDFAQKVSDAFYSGYKVELDEQLVVQFNP